MARVEQAAPGTGAGLWTAVSFPLASFSGSLAPPPTAITFPHPLRGPSRPRPSFGGAGGREDQLTQRPQSAFLAQPHSRRLLPGYTHSCGFNSPRNKNHSPFPGCSAGIHARNRASPLTLPTPLSAVPAPLACRMPREYPKLLCLRTFASALDSASDNHFRDVFRAVFSFKPDFKKHLPKVLTPPSRLKNEPCHPCSLTLLCLVKLVKI